MKFGFSVHRLHRLGYDPDAYTAVARKAEEVGFDSLWIGDHLTFPETLPATYPYSAGGRGPHEPSMPWLDPWITMTHLAAATERVLLATDIYILPLRDPFVTAKAVSTLDLLSRGRTILGVGVGWCEPEFDAVGPSFRNRGRRCDELIDAIKALWTLETVDFRGEHFSFGPVKFEPKPFQQPHPPIHYGGNSPAALQRTAERCDGWISAPQSFDELAERLGRIRQLRRECGRDQLPFEVTTKLPSTASRADVLRHEDVGIDRVTVGPATAASTHGTLRQELEEIERLAESLGVAAP